ncbi:MAG: hypothetical protein ACW97A_03590, partial [Candidatus Thorarchaeota archaeon]
DNIGISSIHHTALAFLIRLFFQANHFSIVQMISNTIWHPKSVRAVFLKPLIIRMVEISIQSRTERETEKVKTQAAIVISIQT